MLNLDDAHCVRRHPWRAQASTLGDRLNERAYQAAGGVDVVCVVVDGAAGVGRGDERVLAGAPDDAVVVLNKCDAMGREAVVAQLGKVAGLGLPEGAVDRREYFPVSARTGEGVEALAAHLLERMPEGPAFFPRDEATDNPEAFWVAELVREQLLHRTEDELPHSIATRVTEWEWPRIRCEILVERDSQKGIVIGKGGAVLKAVGTEVRKSLAPGAYLELVVKVDRNWQRRPAALDRLGF
ncbi:MAG: KH domain-containing protein [Acidimicrobiales bacterium]